jgi:hypothetical protein
LALLFYAQSIYYFKSFLLFKNKKDRKRQSCLSKGAKKQQKDQEKGTQKDMKDGHKF